MADEVNDLTSIQICRDPTWIELNKLKAEMVYEAKHGVSYDDVIQMLLTEYNTKKGGK